VPVLQCPSFRAGALYPKACHQPKLPYYVPALIPFNTAAYSISATTLEQCPPDTAAEVAFVGRSNAGKSSAINKLTSQHKLARTSKTPGRTQLLNFFTLGDNRFLVDLPGFGYAKVPPAMKRKWQQQLERYLRLRKSLKGLVLLMDIRHPFKESDETMLAWCLDARLPLHILLTKSDKLTHGAARGVLLQARKQMEPHADLVSMQLFSSVTGEGVDELRLKVSDWLTAGSAPESSQESASTTPSTEA
jgi:GTP-binding protein